MDEIDYASKIIVKLLEKTEIKEEDEKELIQHFFNDNKVHGIVESFAESANLTLYESSYEDYICIIPKSPRSIFAYNKQDILDRYKISYETYPLFMFYTLCIFYILNELEESSFKVEKIYEIANQKIEKVREDLKKENINEKYNWNFEGILKIWDEMKEFPHSDISQIRAGGKTKLGVLKKTLQILDEEKIIEFIEGNINAVKLTEKTNAILLELSKDEIFNKLKEYFSNS